MKTLAAILIALGFCVVAVLSLPWFMASVGYGIMGDAETEDRILHRCPAWRLLDWSEARG